MTAQCTATRHGNTETAYSWWRCRCPQAREAWRLYKKRLREGRQPSGYTDATGTARRIQALVAIGHDYVALGRHLNVSGRRVADLAQQRKPAVLTGTAATVRDLYRRLAHTPGPSKYARTVAARYGWVSPLAWDDIDNPAARPDLGGDSTDTVDAVAIHRALRGDTTIRLTGAERAALVRHLLHRGAGPTAVADALRCSNSTAKRLIAAARGQENAA